MAARAEWLAPASLACFGRPEIWQAKAEVVHLNEQQVGRGRALTLP